MLHVPPKKLYGLCFSVGSDPGTITSALHTVAQDTQVIRTYSPEPYHQEALDLGLEVVPSVWLDKDPVPHMAVLHGIINAAARYSPNMIVVGNETLLFDRVPADTLVRYLKFVRRHVHRRTLVTTAEEANHLIAHPEVMDACDVVGMHYYPFWNGVHINDALADFVAKYQKIREVSGKNVVVLETGWPSDGGERGSALANLENACRYFSEIMAWSKQTGVPIFWFEAFNELWKADPQIEGPPGAHWGLRVCPKSARKYWPVA